MTVPRLTAMSRYWESNPPVHVMVAAYFGIGKQTQSTTNDEGLAALMQLIPGAPIG